uniref:Uncharacterized protein n=1 Tax=Amphimedon queenslandica TaxID=400682 RepID=A0A1X7SDK9_AMPQE
SVNPSLTSHFNIGSHDARERSHDVRTRSHDSKRSHETGWTSRDSSSRYLRPGTSYQSMNEREGGRGATRPPLSSRTRDLLSSPYLGSIGSSHNRSSSPSRHNPSTLFGATADFRDHKPRPQPHSVATGRPVDVPVVNGVPVTMTRKVVREGGEGGRVKEKRRLTYREEGTIPLSNCKSEHDIIGCYY